MKTVTTQLTTLPMSHVMHLALSPTQFHETLTKPYCPQLTDEKTESSYLTCLASQGW